MFQSLFSWMFSSKNINIGARIKMTCFNPCSLGCFPRRRRRRRRRGAVVVSILVLLDVFLEGCHCMSTRFAGRVSILVLLDVFLEVFDFHTSGIITYSFNPCSLGCFPRSRCRLLGDPGYAGFQSLFSWMFSSKRTYRTCR